MFMSHKNPQNKPQTFLRFPLLLQHCALFSSSNLLLVLLPPSHLLSPSTALSHPGGPSFQHHPPLLTIWSLLYAKQVSARTRRTATTSQRRRQGLGGKNTHPHTLLTCAFSFSVSTFLALGLHAYALHTYELLFFHLHFHTHQHTHMDAHISCGLGCVGAGDRESWSCLSVCH